MFHDRRRQPAQRDSEEPAKRGQTHRLGEELPHHVATPRPDRQPQPDLPGALGDREQHDVHDPDAAHDEGDAGERSEQESHRRGCAGQRAHHLLGGDLVQFGHGSEDERGRRRVEPLRQRRRRLGAHDEIIRQARPPPERVRSA